LLPKTPKPRLILLMVQASNKFKWKSDLDKIVLTQNFERRGWAKC